MRKLKLRISIDGFVAEPNGDEDWNIKPDENI